MKVTIEVTPPEITDTIIKTAILANGSVMPPANVDLSMEIKDAIMYFYLDDIFIFKVECCIFDQAISAFNIRSY